jgi:rod shape-determining protein MreC
MKNKYPSFAMEEGMVISHSSGNYITNFTLNRGTLHGIKPNMPVITKDGIVGYVVEVGLNWCMVSTLIETATSVGAYIPRSEVVGIVSGDYSMRAEGTCKIGYIDATADVQIGDTVYSSGTGSVYPADLKIGTVTSIEVDEYNRTLVATVTPAVDFSSLKWVMVITGYQNGGGDK